MCILWTFAGTIQLDVTARGVRLEVLQEICRSIEAGLLQLPKREPKRPHPRSAGQRLVDGLVKPRTCTKKCSYAEYLWENPQTRSLVGPPNTFLSHPWAEDFSVTVSAVAEYENNLPKGSPPQFYFVDYFAINQHYPTHDLKKLASIVQSCDTLALMAMPWRNPKALTRVWCIFEIANAIVGNTEVTIILPPQQKVIFQESLMTEMDSVWNFMGKIFGNIDSKSAKASVLSDIEKIGKFIKDNLGGFLNVDTLISDVLRSWFLKATSALLENFDHAQKGTIFHAEVAGRTAKFHYGLSRHDDAARFWDEAIAIYKKNNSTRWIPTEKNKLYMFFKMGKSRMILPLAKRNWTLHVKEFGPEHKWTLASKRLLGAIYRDLGMNTKSEKVLRAILDVYAKDEKTYNREIRLTKYQLAWAIRNNGKFDEAAQMYQDLVDANTASLGRTSPNTMVCVSNFARCLSLSKKPESAVSLFEEALPVMRVKWGPDDPQVILGNEWLQEAKSELKILQAPGLRQVRKKKSKGAYMAL